MWLTAGDGYFNIDTALNSLYYPGPNDKHNGGVLLSLQAYSYTSLFRYCYRYCIYQTFIPVGIGSNATVPFDINIIPNPATNMFKLVVNGASDMNLIITITDIEGKTVFMCQDIPQMQDYSKVIDITSFPKGIYMVKVQTDIQTITKKLVIQ